MTSDQRSGRAWRDDPARDVVEELYHDLSEELGTDGPAETFGHPETPPVGRIVEPDEGAHAHVVAEAIGYDSHDTADLCAEESAMHVVTEDDLEREGEEEPDAAEAVRLP